MQPCSFGLFSHVMSSYSRREAQKGHHKYLFSQLHKGWNAHLLIPSQVMNGHIPTTYSTLKTAEVTAQASFSDSSAWHSIHFIPSTLCSSIHPSPLRYPSQWPLSESLPCTVISSWIHKIRDTKRGLTHERKHVTCCPLLGLPHFIPLLSLLFTYKLSKCWKPFTVGMYHIVIVQ